MNIFVFDLDSTITKTELLPEIARAAGMSIDMKQLTQQSLDGLIAFEVSFRQRFDLLKHVPLETVWQVADKIEIDEHIGNFIEQHQKQCVIATGNAGLWVKPITDKLGCRVFASHAELDFQGIPQLLTILYKGEVMQTLRCELPSSAKIIAIGDSANDIPMFQDADFSVAYAGVNEPTEEVRTEATLLVRSGKELVRELEPFL